MSRRVLLAVSGALAFAALAAAPAYSQSADSDGDGTPDSSDQCPTAPGPPGSDQNYPGCPPSDSDGDGTADPSDHCPTVAGPAGSPQNAPGCPMVDSDRDGTSDQHDMCPNQPGPASSPRRGCPADSDFDGVPDASDPCPTKSGPAGGCPDTDGDGIADASDKCPTKRGSKETAGCPDGDQDGVRDGTDRCPHDRDVPKGAVAGCPAFSFEARMNRDTDLANNFLNFSCLPVARPCTVRAWLTVSARDARALGLEGRRLGPAVTAVGNNHGGHEEYRHGQVQWDIPDAVRRAVARRRAIDITLNLEVSKPGSEPSPGKLELRGKGRFEFRRRPPKGCALGAFALYPRPYERNGAGFQPFSCDSPKAFYLQKGK